MDEELLDLIQYRISRVKQTYQEAILMQREGHWNACVNRLYYSAFYVVSALLAKKGLASSKHSGVKAHFNQHFVKSGEVDKEKGRLFNQLFEERQEGDYIDYVMFDKDAVEPLVPKVKDFIDTLSELAFR